MGNVNVHDIEGMTPLHCAAHLGRPRHIALLNEGKAINHIHLSVQARVAKKNAVAECDCTAVDNEGKTALHWTVSNKDPSCILALVDAYPPLLNRR